LAIRQIREPAIQLAHYRLGALSGLINLETCYGLVA
jgi:hypothetical protein